MNRVPFVSPRPYQAPGGVPRGLVAGIVGISACLALAVGWVAGGDRPVPRTGDARAREQLERPDTVRAQPRGSARAVDEAAERAELAARQAAARAAGREARSASGGAAPQSGVSLPVEAVVIGQPIVRAAPDEAEAGRAAREMEARSGESRIFEAAAGAAADMPSAPAAPVEAPEVLAHEAPASPGASAAAPDGAASLEQIVGAWQRLAPPERADAARRSEAWQARVGGSIGTRALAPRPAAGALVIEEGTVIPAVLTRRIGTDAPGVVTAMVSMDVYDSRTARELLLPKGARLVGRYNSEVTAGQARIQFAFTRLILPDGTSFDLPGVVGSDAAGQGGLEADVDRHVLRTFGAALLIGVLADRVVRPEAVPTPGLAGGGLSATGQVLVGTANVALQRNAAIAPTLSIDEGARLNVEVVCDLVFPHLYRMPS
jgi:type IV secretion system protein VirB10